MPDLLDRIAVELEQRRDELRPVVEEYERLRHAAEALAGRTEPRAQPVNRNPSRSGLRRRAKAPQTVRKRQRSSA